MTPTNGNLSVERFSQKPPRNSDLNNVSYREDKRITDLTMDSRVHFEELILQKQSENESLHKRVAELEYKLKTQPNEAYQSLREEKDKADRLNLEILSQIGTLKDAISDFKQRELLNKKLLEDSKKKDLTIQKLKDQLDQLGKKENRSLNTQEDAELIDLRVQVKVLTQAKESYRQ